MTSQYRHRRTSSAATAFPNPLEPGEIAVNTANRQIAIGDAQSGVIGAPLPAIAVRYFDIRAQYVANDFVQNGTSIYRAKGAISPGPFNIANWDMMVGSVDPQYVLKAGDTMSGMLSLPSTVPSVGTHATNKTYVDTGLAGKSTVYSATSPPAGVADNSMWFETDTGLLYVRYNDGNTSQWVIACPQPDISNFVLRSGDNMSGPLGLPLTPTLPAHATSKSYVDGQLAGKSSIISSDTPPVGAIDNSLWYETDSGATYVRYNDLNGGAQWVAIADPAAVAYAAPFDALAYNGMQINGSMEVAQSGTSVAGSGYAIDGWVLSNTSGAAVSLGQFDAVAQGFAGAFSKCLAISVGTADTSLTAAERVCIIQYIEGYRVVRLGWGTASAGPLTVGFWVRHTKAGIYSVSFNNLASDRCYVTTYTQDVANAAEYKTVTVPGDTTGTWPKDNTSGLSIFFTMGVGTTQATATLNAWQAGNFIASTGQVNGVDSAANVLRITGVVVLPGIEAPSAARSPLIMRPYDQELVTCQRYFRRYGGSAAFEKIGVGPAISTTQIFIPLPTSVAMRSSPTISWSAWTDWQYVGSTQGPVGGITIDSFSSNYVGIIFTGASLTTGGSYALQANNTLAARLNVDARL